MARETPIPPDSVLIKHLSDEVRNLFSETIGRAIRRIIDDGPLMRGSLTPGVVPVGGSDGQLTDSRIHTNGNTSDVVTIPPRASDMAPALTAGAMEDENLDPTSTTGAHGLSNTGNGLLGETNEGNGVRGQANADGDGVRGTAAGAGSGVRGENSDTGRAIYGLVTNGASSAAAVEGQTTGDGEGVKGTASGIASAVYANGGLRLKDVSLTPADSPYTCTGAEGIIFAAAATGSNITINLTELPGGRTLKVKHTGTSGQVILVRPTGKNLDGATGNYNLGSTSWIPVTFDASGNAWLV